MSDKIYADNAATTPVSETAVMAMLPYFTERFGNPSAMYSLGSEAKQALEQARGQIAAALNCEPGEIYFTSCGTESDNWAIKGAARRGLARGKNHIITSAIEHHAVLHSCAALEKQGFSVTYLPVDSCGLVNPDDVRRAVTDKTALVSIMYANNEIGTIEPIAEIGAVCRELGVPFHTDAVQAFGNVPIDIGAQNIDMLSLSGHKFNAPKGVGALYIRRGNKLENFMDGGAQEQQRRAGTENVPYIVAMGAAAQHAVAVMEEKTALERRLRDATIDGLLKISHSRLNGARDKRLPGNVNVSFEGIEGESMLLLLNMAGIAASSGSACASGSLDPSHVLLAIGLPAEVAHGSLRITYGAQNTQQDVNCIVENVTKIVAKLRDMSPVWEKIVAADNAKKEK